MAGRPKCRPAISRVKGKVFPVRKSIAVRVRMPPVLMMTTIVRPISWPASDVDRRCRRIDNSRRRRIHDWSGGRVNDRSRCRIDDWGRHANADRPVDVPGVRRGCEGEKRASGNQSGTGVLDEFFHSVSFQECAHLTLYKLTRKTRKL